MDKQNADTHNGQKIDEADEAKTAQQSQPPQQSNVKCSFCGNDTFCAACTGSQQAEAAKQAGTEHMCYGCYETMGGKISEDVQKKTHLCVPPDKAAQQMEQFLDDVTGRAFNDMWEKEKKKLRELSKQEVAEAAFFEGSRFMFHFMQWMSDEQAKEKDGNGQK